VKLPIKRLAVGGALILTSLIVLFFVVMRSSSGSANVEKPLTLTVKTSDLRFDMDTITVKVNQPVTVKLENVDYMEHAFNVDALNVKSDEIEPDQVTSFTFTAHKAGTYQFYCPMEGHAKLGMVGTLKVVS
jgi:plastocyanin